MNLCCINYTVANSQSKLFLNAYCQASKSECVLWILENLHYADILSLRGAKEIEDACAHATLYYKTCAKNPSARENATKGHVKIPPKYT